MISVITPDSRPNPAHPRYITEPCTGYPTSQPIIQHAPLPDHGPGLSPHITETTISAKPGIGLDDFDLIAVIGRGSYAKVGFNCSIRSCIARLSSMLRIMADHSGVNLGRDQSDNVAPYVWFLRHVLVQVLMVKLKKTQKTYAMKIIKKSIIDDEDDIEWVQTEKNVFEQASNHPFLV